MSHGTIPQAVSVYRTDSAHGVADITASAGVWTTLVTLSLTTEGGTRLGVVADVAADVAIGGAIRVLIDGGTFTDTLLPKGEATMLVGDDSPIHRTMGVAIPSGAAATHTLKLQARGEGLMSSVTCNANSDARHHAFLRYVEFV